MGESHPDREILSRFVEGELPSDKALRVDRHLSICSECRDHADKISLVNRLELLDALLSPGYDEAFERAADRATERLVGLREEAKSTEDQLTELLQESPALRRRRVIDEERFHSLALCQLLQARSRENWFSNPAAALEWAGLAVLVAQHLDARRYGSSLVEDSRALSWAYMANTYRISSDLWRAEEAVRQAWFYHLRAGEDVSTETELLSLTCSLRNIQGRYKEATECLDRARVLYREGQDSHQEGAVLIQKGAVPFMQGRFLDAATLFHAGLDKVDQQRDPRLFFMGKHNLMVCLAKAGKPEQAQDLLRHNRYLYQDFGDLPSLTRLRWLEGYIAEGLGRPDEAARLFYEVKSGFMELRSGIDVVFASLDLAIAYRTTGRQRQLMGTLKDVVPLAKALGLQRESLMAHLLYAQASRA